MKAKMVFRIFKNFTKIPLLIAFVISCSTNQSDINKIKGKGIRVKEPVQLNWIGHWKNEGKKGDLIREIARKFEFENQDIKVNLKFPQDIFMDSVNFKEPIFNARIISAAKSDWDIIRIDDQAEDVAVYLNDKEWASKYLVDLNQYPEIRDNHYSGILSRSSFKVRWNNILPGVALDGSNAVLWCNQEVAEKIGIKVKQFDVTFDDFLGYIKAVFEYNKTHNTNFISIFEVEGYSLLEMIPLQLYYSEIGNFGEILQMQFDDKKWDAFKKTIFALEELAQYLPFPRETFTYDKDHGYPLKGNCLFYPQATWMYGVWEDIDSVAVKNLIPVQLPEFKPAESYLGEYRIPWAIPKNAEHIDEAIRLMKYIASVQTADQWIRYAKSPTGIKNSIVSTSMSTDPYENFDYTISKKFADKKFVFSSKSVAFFGEKYAKINLDFHGLIVGKISAVEFLNIVKKQLK